MVICFWQGMAGSEVPKTLIFVDRTGISLTGIVTRAFWKNDFTKVKKCRGFLANRGRVSHTLCSNDLCSSLKIAERKAATCYRTNTTHTTLLPLINTLYFSHVLLEWLSSMRLLYFPWLIKFLASLVKLPAWVPINTLHVCTFKLYD